MDSKVSEPWLYLILLQILTEPILPWKKNLSSQEDEKSKCQEHIYPPGWSEVAEAEVSSWKTVICAWEKVAALVSLQIKLVDTKGPAACATSWASLSSPAEWPQLPLQVATGPWKHTE